MAGVMACVWKHPASKNWFARFTNERGLQVNRTTKTPDRRAAQIQADAFEHAAKLARRGTLTTDNARAILSEILERSTGGAESIRSVPAKDFFADWLAHKASSKASGTAERYAATVAQFLAHLGARADKPLVAIRAADVQAYLTGRGKVRASKTVKTDAKSLSAAFAYARRQGLIDRNPVDTVELPKVRSMERTGFTPAQVKLLLDTATGDWRTAILLGYATGARLSDVVSLQWSDLNLITGTLSYRQRKTDERVTTELNDEARAYLESIAGDTAGPVMPSLAGRTTGGNTGLSRQFNDLMRAAGIAQDRATQKSGRTFAALSFHSLRHGFESILADKGVSSERRRKLTGRASEATQKLYTHLESETQRRAVNLLPTVLK